MPRNNHNKNKTEQKQQQQMGEQKAKKKLCRRLRKTNRCRHDTLNMVTMNC